MFCAAAARVAVEERKQGAAFSSPDSLLKILRQYLAYGLEGRERGRKWNKNPHVLYKQVAEL
jgi:hypothetical protein